MVRKTEKEETYQEKSTMFEIYIVKNLKGKLVCGLAFITIAIF